MTDSSVDSGKCPIDHSKLSQAQWEQMKAAHANIPNQPKTPKSTPPSPPACDSDAASVNDNFPDVSHRSPNQKFPLSAIPVNSSIPRSGVDPKTGADYNTWIYPSPQRFYNAMERKGWNPSERDMPHVVSIHNTVNERTWAMVKKWEEFHSEHCKNPRLARFKGRPNDLSPKARLMSTMMGYSQPFDRHDWIVDRCGQEVRYIIDFYPGQGADDFNNNNLSMGPAIHIDARPAVDSPSAIIDRIRMTVNDWIK